MLWVRWVLLDRDGTINKAAPAPGYITQPAQVELLPQAAAAIGRLNNAGLPVAVVTNQRGVALGLMTETDLNQVNATLREQLALTGAHVDAILCCTHDRNVCQCRKPRTGLLEDAAHLFSLPLEQAIIVGDSETDVEAGRRAGTCTIRLGEGGTQTSADLVAPTLWAAVDALLAF
jgi:D-glycero-D-manno-heptose 1,7-bisphosphate phosphatase